MTELEQRKTAEQTASGLTSDIRAVYGLFGMPRYAGTASGGKRASTSIFTSPSSPFAQGADRK